jgi:transcription elongation factor GreA
MEEQCPDKVAVGTWAKVTGFVRGEEEVFHIVPDAEADPIDNKIPPGSPLARALMGAKEGDIVIFRPPSGEVELTVLELGRS